MHKIYHSVINNSIKESYSIHYQPPVRIYGINPINFRAQDLEAVQVNNAIIEMGELSNRLLSQTQTSYCLLAMLGVSNDEISDLTSRSINTVKTQLSLSFNRLGVRSRSGISRILLTNNVVRLTQRGTEIGVSSAEHNIIDGITRGLSNKEIACENTLSPLTVKAHISRITHRTGWNSRELIGLSAMVSGEIADIETVETNWVQEAV